MYRAKLLKSRQQGDAVAHYLCDDVGFPRSSKHFRRRASLQVSPPCKPPPRSHRKGWRGREGGRGEGLNEIIAGIMETNATSWYTRYWRNIVRSGYRLIVCRILRSWGGRSSFLAARAFRGSNFADAVRTPFLLSYRVTQEAHPKENQLPRHVHDVSNVARRVVLRTKIRLHWINLNNVSQQNNKVTS